ncbi:MAG: putative molybdenum carrier protein [Bacteroidales bacterium]
MCSIIIISGGQTGVDQGAMDYALDHRIPCGGYCPKNRISESGKIPDKYPLTELNSDKYFYRTEKNVIASDGTLIIEDQNQLGEGTRDTIQLCIKHFKPYQILNVNSDLLSKQDFTSWLESEKIKVLNVAGNRESQSPGIQEKTYSILNKLLK